MSKKIHTNNTEGVNASTSRTRAFAAQQKARGLDQINLWVPPGDKMRVKDYAKRLVAVYEGELEVDVSAEIPADKLLILKDLAQDELAACVDLFIQIAAGGSSKTFERLHRALDTVRLVHMPQDTTPISPESARAALKNFKA